MSRLGETQRAYDKIRQLLDQEIRQRRGAAKELEQFRETLNVAFYLLGWAQFEYLVRKGAENLIDDKAKSQTIDRHAWRYLKENVKNISVRNRLDLIFHDQPAIRTGLYKDYERRNEAAHDNKLLPREAKDLSVWLENLEELVEKFQSSE